MQDGLVLSQLSSWNDARLMTCHAFWLLLNRKVAILEGLHHCGARLLVELAELQLRCVKVLPVLHGALSLPLIRIEVVEGQSCDRAVGFCLLFFTWRTCFVCAVFALKALQFAT